MQPETRSILSRDQLGWLHAYLSLENVIFKKMSLDNKKALEVFLGLVQIQAKSAFLGDFRVLNKDYCLINPENSLDNLILKILNCLNYGTVRESGSLGADGWCHDFNHYLS